MGHFVQAIFLVVLAVCALVAVLVFRRLLTSDRSKLLSFLLVQVLICIPVVVLLWVYAGPPESVGGFLLVTVLLTMVGNLPIAIVAKIIGAIADSRARRRRGRRRRPERPEAANPRMEPDAATPSEGEGRPEGKEE